MGIVRNRDISFTGKQDDCFTDKGINTFLNSTYTISNEYDRTGGLVVGTGDLSELALGWATYNGDHMSMYGVNAGVPKTLVRHIVRYEADTAQSLALRRVLLDILDTPVSPELLPATETGEIAQREQPDLDDARRGGEQHKFDRAPDLFLFLHRRYPFRFEYLWT